MCNLIFIEILYLNISNFLPKKSIWLPYLFEYFAPKLFSRVCEKLTILNQNNPRCSLGYGQTENLGEIESCTWKPKKILKIIIILWILELESIEKNGFIRRRPGEYEHLKNPKKLGRKITVFLYYIFSFCQDWRWCLTKLVRKDTFNF